VRLLYEMQSEHNSDMRDCRTRNRERKKKKKIDYHRLPPGLKLQRADSHTLRLPAPYRPKLPLRLPSALSSSYSADSRTLRLPPAPSRPPTTADSHTLRLPPAPSRPLQNSGLTPAHSDYRLLTGLNYHFDSIGSF